MASIAACTLKSNSTGLSHEPFRTLIKLIKVKFNLNLHFDFGVFVEPDNIDKMVWTQAHQHIKERVKWYWMKSSDKIDK